MSMNQDTENFDQLRRLLALKRHEQPPPGYFNNFSSQVIARIKLGDEVRIGLFVERLLWEAPWLQRIWAALEAKPILAGVLRCRRVRLADYGRDLLGQSGRAAGRPRAGRRIRASDSMEVATGSAAADHPLLAKPAVLSRPPAPARLRAPEPKRRSWATSRSFGPSPPASAFSAGN